MIRRSECPCGEPGMGIVCGPGSAPRRVGLLVATFQPAWASRSAFNCRRERVSARSQAHSASQAHACGQNDRTAVTVRRGSGHCGATSSPAPLLRSSSRRTRSWGRQPGRLHAVRRACPSGPPYGAVTEPWRLRAANPNQYRRSRPRKGISMSRQHRGTRDFDSGQPREATI